VDDVKEELTQVPATASTGKPSRSHSVRKVVLIALFIAFAASCSNKITSKAEEPCGVPEPALAQIASAAAYYYRDQAGPTKKESYSAVLIGVRWFFRDNNPEGFDGQGLRSVSKYEDGKWDGVRDLQCPSDASWVTCAAAWNPYRSLPANSPMAYLKEQKPEPVTTTSCDFEVKIPNWTPSPDNAKKRQIASEVLQELLTDSQTDSGSTTSGDAQAKRVVIEPRVRGQLRSVYIRDFNLNDPEVHVYFEDSKEKWVRRFAFDSTKKPHIAYSGAYGTVTVESIRDWIMEQPYRLYPPPIGKP